MPLPPDLLSANRAWSQRMVGDDPDYFRRLATQQSPKYMWIGCADSRVPANQITGLAPGEIFVHRNVANLVVHSDLNMLSTVQFAVEVLGVEHIIICGHYGCGGVKAALNDERHGLVDNWLNHIRDTVRDHRAELQDLDEGARLDRLCELNVLVQRRNLAMSTVVTDAWHRGHSLSLHAWAYRLDSGLINTLGEAWQGPPMD